MKKALLIASLLALALAACSKKDPKVEAAEYAQQMRNQDFETIGGLKIAILMKNTNYDLGYSTRLLCVDGTTYVTYGGNITVHLSPEDGKPVACSIEEDAE
jgi:hypothetical protein